MQGNDEEEDAATRRINAMESWTNILRVRDLTNFFNEILQEIFFFLSNTNIEKAIVEPLRVHIKTR